MESTATLRYVNLGRARTVVPGPNGQPVTVHPFEDSLNPRIRKPDAVYVVEGAFWRKYTTAEGTGAQLHPFPRPSAYGLTSFPDDFSALRDDGATVDLGSGSVLSPGASVGVAASPGVRRVAGDVITPEGKIRKRNSETGEDELVDDVEENRHMRHSAIPAGEEPINVRNPEIRDGIETWLTNMGVESADDLAALADDTLLGIPGINAHNLPMLRKNLTAYFQQQEGIEAAPVTPVGANAATATVNEVLVGDDEAAQLAQDEFAPDETEEPEGDAVARQDSLPARTPTVEPETETTRNPATD